MKPKLQRTFALISLALLLLLLVFFLFIQPKMHAQAPTEPTDSEPTTPSEPSAPAYGWRGEGDQRYYLLEDGTRYRGWMEEDGVMYFFDENSFLHIGWLEQDGATYYFLESGAMATGKHVIDGLNCYFTADGKSFLLVNPWAAVPEGYQPNLVPLPTTLADSGLKIDRACYDALLSMITDAHVSGEFTLRIISAYRTQQTQMQNFNRHLDALMAQGYSYEEAYKQAATIVAVPGTSEHQLGLAVDIIDMRLLDLTEEQADTPGQQWLMEHCWEYGFILRYPKDKTNETGIIYEPWHYRYVGEEVAADLHASGQTLEGYLASLH